MYRRYFIPRSNHCATALILSSLSACVPLQDASPFEIADGGLRQDGAAESVEQASDLRETRRPAADAGSKDPSPAKPKDSNEDSDSPESPKQHGEHAYAKRPSRGAAIASDESAVSLAVANRATNDVTIFAIDGVTERARVKVGAEPVSVTFSPDGTMLYVVNRADGTVSIIRDAASDYPSVVATVSVGSEPGLAALSPSGATLYVSSWVDGTLSVIDTQKYAVRSHLVLGGAPFAVCVTNDGDDDDSDESIFVTDFYSRPLEDTKESEDGSRQARVFRVAASDPSKVASTSYLLPILVKGIEPGIDAAETQAFPNQLFACSVHENDVYVTAVGASPAAFDGTTDFRQNVHGLVYALDASDGHVKKSVNLSELVAALPGPKRFAAVPNDLEFIADSQIAYITVQSADMLLRVDFGAEPPAAGLAGINFLPTGESPTGLTIVGKTAFAYNEVSRSVSEIDLMEQAADNPQTPSAPLPKEGSTEALALRGQKFFNTANARWSTASWVSCASCHPGATTDNVTWSFPAGPRQTVDTSATFNADGRIQRILNWTAIFDEVHDFELNTRGVANGVGAIVTDPALDVQHRIDFVGPGGVADPINGFNVGSVRGVNDRDGVLDDWDNIELYLKSVRSPKGASHVAGDPDAGREVFARAGCQNCHGGALWTLSERYFEPVLDGDLREITFAQAGITSIGDVAPWQTVLDDIGFDEASVIGNDANGAPQRHLCSVRIVGTFDAQGPLGRGAVEVRQNGAPAQGPDGFNVPSLLNMSLGAPYLHHGAVETLEELFDPYGDFVTHLQAGNPQFYPNEYDVRDLVAFVRSIDESTPTFEVPATQRFCPEGVVPPVAPVDPEPAPEPEPEPDPYPQSY